MSEVNLMEKYDIAKALAGDVINNVTDDLSQYDRIYSKLMNRRAGRTAFSYMQSAGWMYADIFDHHTKEPQLFPEIESSELEVAMTAFASQIAKRYADNLFMGSFRRHRIYSKEVSPYPDGVNRDASTYIDGVWAPKYAAEFVQADSLGLTKESAAQILSLEGATQ